MKRILTLLFFISAQISFAQNYYPFQDSSAEWSQAHSFRYGFVGGNQITSRDGWLFCLGKDTIINSRKYSLIGYQKTWNDELYNGSPSSGNNYPISRPGKIFGAIREDSNKKVWFRNLFLDSTIDNYCSNLSASFPAGTEALLYDFNLHIGDTLYWSILFPAYPRVVIRIDSVQLYDNSYHKRYFFREASAGFPADFWIEGIGSSLGLFGSYQYVNVQGKDETCYLNCYSYGGNLMYYLNPPGGNNLCNVTPYAGTGVNDEDKTSLFAFYPNPMEDKIYLSLGKGNNKDIQIKNLLGEIVIQKETIAENYTLDISSLCKGIYFIAVGNNKNKVFIKKLVKN